MTTLLNDLESIDDPEEVAAAGVAHLRSISGARWAEVVQTAPSGTLSTLAATDPALTDELRRCRDVTEEPPAPGTPGLGPFIVVDDLATSSPWPAFAARAADTTPVRSAAFTFVAAGGAPTVIPVYDDRPGFFTTELQQTVNLAARVIGIVLAQSSMAAQTVHLRAGMASRQQIGIATGILCSKYGLAPTAAFGLLRVTSSHTNRKLRAIAAEVVEQGDLPAR